MLVEAECFQWDRRRRMEGEFCVGKLVSVVWNILPRSGQGKKLAEKIC